MKTSVVAVSLLLASSIITPTALASDAKVLMDSSLINVVEFSDEFTEKVTSCQVNIGEYERGKARFSLFGSSPARIGIAGKVGAHSGSGFMLKVDSGEIYEFGAKYPGGDPIFPDAPNGIMEQLSNGKTVVIRVHPDNQFVDTATNKYSLKGSSKAISLFQKCLADI
ncbi:hypothetical protein BCT04_13555 [Vibrio breoganii]|uniref:hypothetical protein n=1 Tax=Vibrio breoganii TaxID=553239 RepID=UPI000C860D6C|nr:hypothetical protein [Vibrio breoganii]PMO64549.1 hypothetical protein BCT04_13555 [Vibrio breoganii]